jgi:outer membrane biosynthesis protein TonB
MVANVPTQSLSSGKFRRGYGLDPIKSDLPLGSALSLLVHTGILLSALLAWQATPRIMPEEVVSVDVVSDTPSVVGENTVAETAQTGVETPNPSPLPQTTPSAPSEALPTPVPSAAPPQEIAPAVEQTEITQAPPAVATPPSPPSPPPPPPQSAPAAVPTQRPLPKPAPTPAPTPRAAAQPAPKPAPATKPKAAPPAKTGQRQSGPATLPEFDMAAASKAASGADSGGRSPQLASRGKAGKLGKAGGGAELTGDLEAALRAQLKRCWVPPADMSNPRQLIVVISIDLAIDGQLLRQPVLVSPASADGASQRLIVAIDNAKRAVNGCSPFNLPPDRYDSWKQVRFKFDPELMARRQ